MSTEGRLAPATVVIQGIRLVRSTAPLFLVSLVHAWREPEMLPFSLGIAGVAVFLGLVSLTVHWLRYRWRFTTDSLEVESGILGRQVRRIPLSRIQDVDTSQGILERMFGVVVLSVHTSSTQKAEVELATVSKSDAELLMTALKAGVGGGASAAVTATTAPALLTIRTSQLILRGLTDNRAGLVVATGLAAFERLFQGSEGLIVDMAEEARRGLLPPEVAASGPLAWSLVAMAAVFALVIVGYVASMVFNVVTFHGYSLRLEGDRSGAVFRREYGLFTRRSQALPRERIQALVLGQSPVRRLLGVGSLRAHDMGSSSDPKSGGTTGRDGFVPIAPVLQLRALVPLAFPGLPHAPEKMRPVSSRMVRRMGTLGLLFGGLLGALVLGAATQVGGASLPIGALVLALSATGGALIGTLYGRLAHARLRVSAHRGFFVVHRGVLWSEEVTVPAARIEAAILSRTPLDRFHGVATVTVVVGGGDRFSVANVSLPHAAELIGDLQAAESGEASGSLWGAS